MAKRIKPREKDENNKNAFKKPVQVFRQLAQALWRRPGRTQSISQPFLVRHATQREWGGEKRSVTTLKKKNNDNYFSGIYTATIADCTQQIIYRYAGCNETRRFRECHVPDTSVVKYQDKSQPAHVHCGVSKNIRTLILNDIGQPTKTMWTFGSDVKQHEN